MTTCTNCGAQNADGTKFCSTCGTPLPATSSAAPSPESWRADADINDRPSGSFGATPSGYTPPAQPSSYPVFNQPATGGQYGQQGYGQSGYGATGQNNIHPIVPALVSFFFPGIGLLFVPNKVPLALGIFGSYIALNIVLFILAVVTFGIGTCLFLAVPLISIAAAIHSYDEAAKNSGGQYAPLLFKN